MSLKSHHNTNHNTMYPFYMILKPRSRKQKSILCLLFIILIQFFFLSIYQKTSQNFKQIPIIQTTNPYQYDHLIDVFQIKDFISKPLQTKMKLYFDSLYKYNQDWQISTLSNYKYYKKLSMESDYKNYYKKECEKEWLRLNIQDKEQRQQICTVVRSAIFNNWKQNKFIENEIFNFIGHLKIYNQLFILNNLQYPVEFNNFEQKIFPFFTGNLPILKKNFEDDDEEQNIDKPFVQHLLQSYKGKGIVFTTSDNQVDDLIKNLKVLCFLENKLPIQIIHRKQELSQESQDRIFEFSQQQSITFVDITPCIKSEYDNFFNGYSMKFLLTIFNSFDEMIFMDNDAVPFTNPSDLFNIKQYQDSKIFFFKDRNFQNKGLNQQNLNFFKMLLPSVKFDSKFFQIELLKDDSILYNNFFKMKSRHFIDSGLFLMQKKTHLGGVLCSLHLSTWTPTSHFVYGDKELFWLGQLIVGNHISISQNFASVSGKLIPYEGSSLQTQKICTSKLTHLSNDNKILWINGGLNYCNSFNDNDLTLYKGRFKDSLSLQTFFAKPLSIEAIIKPSDNLNEYHNEDNEPIRNWEFEPLMGCNNRFFCSFDKFGGVENNISNELIILDDDTKLYYNTIVETWSN